MSAAHHVPPPQPKHAQSPSRLAVIDGLRGVAIALVLWFHVWQITWLPADIHAFGTTFNLNVIPETGFIGVSLFFFLSGFCVFYPYARTRFDGAPRQTFAVFFRHRFAKIVPSYVLFIVVLVLIGRADGVDTLANAVRNVGLHLLFIHNWFPDSYGTVNGVLWSLAVEVQFYVVFPLVCALVLRFPVAGTALLFAVAQVYRLSVAPHTDTLIHTMDQLPGVLDLFAAGMATAYAYRSIAVRLPALAARRRVWTLVAIAGVAGAIVLLLHLFAIRREDNWGDLFSVWHRPLFAASFALVALGSLFAHRAWQRMLANPLLLGLGFVSYNLYLWHQVVAHALLDAHVPAPHTRDPHADASWQFAALLVDVAAGIAVAALVTYAFERPVQRICLGRTRRRAAQARVEAGAVP